MGGRTPNTTISTDRARGPLVTSALPLILFTVLSNAAAQIMLKRGMMMVGRVSLDPSSLLNSFWDIALNPFIIAGFFTFCISMASHMVVLSRVDLSFAYPFLSLAYIVVTAYAYFVFDEDVSQLRVAGIALICLGTVLVSRS
jgi:drug/metabolite transporter (DMT)-like permease